MEALLLPVGGAWHAVELLSVREVVCTTPTTPVPNAPPWLIGLANLRGEIVPVVDSAAALGDEPLVDPSHLVVVETARGKAALAATGAPSTIDLGEPSGASECRGGRGRYTLDDRVASLLDLDALVTS
ncbi:MAG: purine-binding chemotaxis protein CheW [Acidimicrobiaceae bacterium]